MILSTDLLTKAFPFYLAFNREMQLMHLGEAMLRLCPGLELGKALDQFFWVKHPNVPLEFDAISRETKSLFLLEALHDHQQFKGQILHNERKGLIFFLGSPWISDNDDLKTLGHKLTDRPSKESISDFLLLIQARGTTLSDTRRLAEKLAKQRSEMQKAVRKAELATAVLEQAADAVEVTDADFQILYVNKAFERITGFSRDEALGKTPLSLFCTEPHEQAIYEEIQQVIAKGEIWQGILQGKRKGGVSYQHEATVFPVQNSMDAMTNIVTIKRELSDRKSSPAPEDPGGSLSLLQTTFEATADG
ncbi:MAG: PAS domain S-box protein, partial [Oculatellaceae cyanobacterium Prado106]|nr:PAS domain S-box protein [Oculatellaceae cyanobacterium Prado106]